MCGRFFIPSQDVPSQLEALLESLNRQRVKTHGELFPGDIVPVIARGKDLAPHPFGMKWGYSLAGTSPAKKSLVFNARSETADSSPLFRDGMQQRRCLLPAVYYREWEKRDGKKLPYDIKPQSSDYFFLAGLYRFEEGQPVCTVLTRDPAESIRFIHNRMPVMLPPSLLKQWLDPAQNAVQLLRAALTQVEYRAA